jgi:hypothetical protein
MARTNLPLTPFDPAAGITAPATTAIDVANGMNIALASSVVPAASSSWDLIIKYDNTFAGAKSIIVRAGANPPSSRAGKGDLTVGNTTQTSYVGPFEPARFLQADGSINIDFTAATTGTVTAFILPHRGLTG